MLSLFSTGKNTKNKQAILWVLFYFLISIIAFGSYSIISSLSASEKLYSTKGAIKLKNRIRKHNIFNYDEIESNYSCDESNHYVFEYGQDINVAVGFSSKHKMKKAYGCSTNSYYCTGEPKELPCCTYIMFLQWYAFEKYMKKYNIDYSLRWGSALFALRDGKHATWDSRDIDLAFMYPIEPAKKVRDEFIKDYNQTRDKHHIADPTAVFYKEYHKKYGYPKGKFCFISTEFTFEYLAYRHIETIQLAGYHFLDIGIGDEGATPFDKENLEIFQKNGDSSNIRKIPIKYEGSNGLGPPRDNLYVYWDTYKHLDPLYTSWRNGLPSFINKEQLKFHGYEWNSDYWEANKKKISELVGNDEW